MRSAPDTTCLYAILVQNYLALLSHFLLQRINKLLSTNETGNLKHLTIFFSLLTCTQPGENVLTIDLFAN